MNIDAIKGQFKDYARSNLFILQFSRLEKPPQEETEALRGFAALKAAAKSVLKSFFAVPAVEMDQLINLGVKGMSFPNVTSASPEFEWKGMLMPTVGPVKFGEFTCTFIIDHDMIIYNYFLAWLNSITNFYTGQGRSIITEDLKSEIFISQLKSDMSINDKVYKTTLHNAYPTTISEIQLTEEENFAEFNVTFRYMNISNNNITADLLEDANAQKSWLDKIKGKIGGFIP